MHDRLFDGSAYRLLNVLDEYTRECLVIHVSRSIKSKAVIQVLWEVMQTSSATANCWALGASTLERVWTGRGRTLRRKNLSGLSRSTQHRKAKESDSPNKSDSLVAIRA